tara:strand:+ start:889 stop:1479 length:591 start_codon:yes stop_codon:yes gene_type:complete
MPFKKYTDEQKVERIRAQAAIKAARTLLKNIREEKKNKKQAVTQFRRDLKTEIRRRKDKKLFITDLRREIKSEIRRRKDKKLFIAQLRRELKSEIRRRKEYKLAKGRLMAVLRRVYKPYMVARRKFHRLKIAREKRIAAARLDLDQENWIQEPLLVNPDNLPQPPCDPPKPPLPPKLVNNSSDFIPRRSPRLAIRN